MGLGSYVAGIASGVLIASIGLEKVIVILREATTQALPILIDLI
jgi:hypothetical protein